MNRTRSRRVVPRFRRSNQNVDIDDLEAQRQIDEDLKSVFIWSADLPSTPNDLPLQSFGHDQHDEKGEDLRQFISDVPVDEQLDLQLDDDDDDRRAKTNFGHDDRSINLDDVSDRPREKYLHLIPSDDGDRHRQFDLHETNSSSSSNGKTSLLDDAPNQRFDLEEDWPRIDIERRFLSEPMFLHQVRRIVLLTQSSIDHR